MSRCDKAQKLVKIAEQYRKTTKKSLSLDVYRADINNFFRGSPINLLGESKTNTQNKATVLAMIKEGFEFHGPDGGQSGWNIFHSGSKLYLEIGAKLSHL
jgi:hypothetical protein